MKRYVLLFILAILPLQITWAAGVAHCPPGGDYLDSAFSADAASGAVHEHLRDADGHAAGSGQDCGAFQFVAIEPSTPLPHPLLQAGNSAHGSAYAGYRSHIPAGPDRPNWCFAA